MIIKCSTCKKELTDKTNRVVSQILNPKLVKNPRIVKMFCRDCYNKHLKDFRGK